ncbi:unnamed protein product [marine sediment metagenome]|uniref:Uncharacterized protein n=1 Tax=marine sediment metagenome TaxID=412755 RepID=X1QYL6_9ZZZZ
METFIGKGNSYLRRNSYVVSGSTKSSYCAILATAKIDYNFTLVHFTFAPGQLR